MSALQIDLNEGRTAYEPGDEVVGRVIWNFSQRPTGLQLRLFWFTRGKGTPEIGVVETIPFDRVLAEESRPFRMRLPEAPISFSGALITLSWALELVAEPSRQVARAEIISAPGGAEVRLQSVLETPAKKRWLVFPAR